MVRIWQEEHKDRGLLLLLLGPKSNEFTATKGSVEQTGKPTRINPHAARVYTTGDRDIRYDETFAVNECRGYALEQRGSLEVSLSLIYL